MPLPPLDEVLLKAPLYRLYELSGEVDTAVLESLERGSFQLDAFCVHCERETVFRCVRDPGKIKAEELARRLSGITEMQWHENRLFSVFLLCTRQPHLMAFYFQVADKKLRKIGQTPSLTDLGRNEFKRYAKVLGPDRRRELFDATGLASQGKGIAALTYLRRVFESLLEDHRIDQEKSGAPIADWVSMRVPERVEALSAHLPKFLVDNAYIYGILSQGVHELDEQTCLTYFPALREGTLLILEQDYEAREKKKRQVALHAELQKIAAKRTS